MMTIIQHTALSLALVGLVGCASVPVVGTAPNRLEPSAMLAPDVINWPAAYRPEDASFFVTNTIDVDAPPEAVWALLVDAAAWPSWYEGAREVVVDAAPDGRLAPGRSFTWATMGFTFTSSVTEFVPPFRLSWESRKSTLQGYHAWLIVPTARGCRVVTEESQHGVLTLLQKIFVPNDLRALHDVWLAELKRRAEAPAALAGTTEAALEAPR